MKIRFYIGGMLLLIAIAVVLQWPMQVVGTTLNGFDIKTDAQNKEVQVILQTDGKIQYDTQKQGDVISIVLEDAVLSEEQQAQGMPVVMDQHNRFIGRAVPSKGNTVKVIIPNLPVDEYAVTVREQYPDGQLSVAKRVYQPAADPGVLRLSRPPQMQQKSYIASNPIYATPAASPVQRTYGTPAVSSNGLTPIMTGEQVRQATEPAWTKRQANPPEPMASPGQPLSPVTSDDKTPYIHPVTAPKTVADVASQGPAEPRSAVGQLDTLFESIAQQFPKPKKVQKVTQQVAKNPRIDRIEGSQAAQRSTANGIARLRPIPPNVGQNMSVSSSYPMWNPYVVGAAAPVTQPAQSLPQAERDYGEATWTPPNDDAVSAMAYSDGDDTLDVLHNLPPLEEADLAHLTEIEKTEEPSTALPQATTWVGELKQLAKRVPLWAYILAGLFVGSLGLFAVIGSVYLLWMMFRRKDPTPVMVQPVPMDPNLYGTNVHWAQSAPVGMASPGYRYPNTSESPAPERVVPTEILFEDTVAVDARKYIKQSPTNVKQAVNNGMSLANPQQMTQPSRRAKRATRKGTSVLKRVSSFL